MIFDSCTSERDVADALIATIQAQSLQLQVNQKTPIESGRTEMGKTDAAKDEVSLLENISARLQELDALLALSHSHWGYEDPVYRYYHQSFKVYFVQQTTEQIVKVLQSLLPNRALNLSFLEIVKEGTAKSFKMEDNDHWAAVTRPMLEAFFHAKYFLEMICKYGRELTAPPQSLPSGWAAVLYLYGIR